MVLKGLGMAAVILISAGWGTTQPPGGDPGPSSDGQTLMVEGVAPPTYPKLQEMSIEESNLRGADGASVVQAWIEEHRSTDLSATEPTLDGVPLSELEDLAEYARAEGMTVLDAVKEQAVSDEFQAVSWKLESLFPENYAGMEFRRDGGRTWFGFNGEAPQEAVDLIGTLPGSSQVVVGDFIPKSDWGRAVSDVRRQVAATLNTEAVSVGFDAADKTFLVTQHVGAAAPNTISSTKIDDLEKIVNSSLVKAGPGSAYAIEVETSTSTGELTDSFARGGGYLDNVGCTAGFILTSNVGRRIGTAGHCALPDDYATYRLHGSDGGSTTSVVATWRTFSYSTPASTPQFDLGIYSTGSFTGYPSFYYNPGQKREVSGAASGRYDVGVTVCFFGRTTYDGASCGYVTDSVQDHYFAGDGVTLRGVTEFSRAPQPGDSGGPVFRRTWAVGIVNGRDSGRGYFTPVHLYKDYGLSVLIS
jgi:hypothetical protein